jgi:hypothetical protein
MDDKDNALLGTSGTTPEKSRWAVVSFVLANVALAGLFLSQLLPIFVVFYLAFPGAIVFGHLGKRDLRREPERYTGFAMAQYGLMVGYFCLMITAMVVTAMFRGYQIGGA